MPWPDPSLLAAYRQQASQTAEIFQLPLSNANWRGVGGNWQGAGIGNSIDFQDHRPYLPGDDPRYINWQAFARTGHYSMKLYREEVSPRIDLAFDFSESMFFDRLKLRRAFEMVYFAAESALRSAASLRTFAVNEVGAVPWSLDQLMAGSRPDTAQPLREVPWRPDSLRVWITDLLFPGDPSHSLAALSMGRGRGLIFAVGCEAEASPDWDGNLEFEDCESARRQSQHVSSNVRTRYQAAYTRHFSLWQEQSRKYAVTLARVAAEPDFPEALRQDALAQNALEWRK